ncbi:HNH endonuclease signature motif containing protein [Amnibacterium endophyticum]|uniref:DUF222 domain-containing protein n=1 Tax=Amnibacterium endophyticum TaxID=2109337 RepID=A0ABW4LB32_9MICO
MAEGSGGATVSTAPIWEPHEDERLLARRRRLFIPWAAGMPSWFLEAAMVRDRRPGDPDVHEALSRVENEPMRVWVLTELHRRRLDPAATTVRLVHLLETEVPEDVWEALEVADDSIAEPDPVLAALDEVSGHQLLLQRAEAQRVLAAVAAWRAALAEEAEPRASNTPYQRGVLADLAHRLKVAQQTARSLVHTAMDLEEALPAVWRYFRDGLTTWRVMQTVHTHLDGLDPALHPEFDAAALRKIVEVSPTGLPDALRRLRERLQASTADDRHERASARRHVAVEPAADGMAWLHAYLPAVDALALDHQLTKAAVHARGRQGETRGVGQLRADVLVDGLRQALRKPRRAGRGTLVPGRRGVEPQVCVTIPALTALGHSREPATLEGYGTIGLRTALRLAGEAKAWVRVLTDPVTGGVLALGRTRYRPSKDMRVLLRMLDGGTRGPTRPRAPGEAEVDHVVPYRQDGAGGPTEIGNLVLLTHREHRDKTDEALAYGLLPDRTALWRTPTGTTIVTRPVEPLTPTLVPPELIDPDDCPF